MRAHVGGHEVASSSNVTEVGGYTYFPADSVAPGCLSKAARTAEDNACPHGVQFYDVIVGDRRLRRAAWQYERPQPALNPEMAAAAGRFAFWGEVQVED